MSNNDRKFSNIAIIAVQGMPDVKDACTHLWSAAEGGGAAAAAGEDQESQLSVG